MFRWEMRTIINWVIVIAIVMWIFKDPTAAAHEVQRIFGLIGHAGSSFITFVTTAVG